MRPEPKCGTVLEKIASGSWRALEKGYRPEA